MCKLYHVKYSCGCVEDRPVSCAESPNTFGTCAAGYDDKDEAHTYLVTGLDKHDDQRVHD
ncbi:uncharacterized protein GGS22DRAFT_191378 [Annulohypoxylon maeteangense]|uniref:uncharacterized protein n=1 Tax=Annulohypoxylon maeteangense TaxID=1927788 RepID=UPI00200737D7|nr:uncharacterized protein GGS22DRAFT_191378 [Annulohypoxylon maeteangense]KAI0882209.1 hypothetical protein GGS22DRAFT_191378 [Annulohypoxylon maeteangense]